MVTATAHSPRQPEQARLQSSSELARHQFSSLESWIQSDSTMAMGLHEVERGEEQRGRELSRLLLQAHMDCRGDGDAGPAVRVCRPDCSAGGELYTHRRMHARTILSIFGKVVVRRIGYGTKGASSIHPLDESLQLPARMYSYEVQRRLVKKAVQGPFDEAVEALAEGTGTGIPKRSAEEILIDASIDFDSFYARRQETGRGHSSPILVGSVDCKGIPMVKAELAVKTARRGKGQKAQKKKMATVAVVFTQAPRMRTPEQIVESLYDLQPNHIRDRKQARPERKRVWASLLASKDSFIAKVHEEMNRRDPDCDKLRVVVTDGERALQDKVSHLMKDTILVLDLLHVLEKLWDVAHTLYGEGSPLAIKFARSRTLRILRGQVTSVVKGFRIIATRRNLKGKKRDTVLKAANYYHRNRSRMCYSDYLDYGLPIASGSVEGACKNLVKDRMERSGMRWTARMAEAMVKMRATYLSGDFEAYWDYHVTQEQRRLYPDGRWTPIGAVVQE